MDDDAYLLLEDIMGRRNNSYFLAMAWDILGFGKRPNVNARYRIPRVQGYVDIRRQLRPMDFKSHFRLYPSTVAEILDSIYRDFLVRLSYEMKMKGLLLSLWYFANIEGFRQIADRFGVARATAHRTVTEFSRAICRNRKLCIRWPTEKLHQTVASFDSLRENAFPGVIGAIDGCHIRILAPWKYRQRMPHLDRNSFINRKQVSTILLQGICNAELEFINVFAGWPGSSNDARVFRRSDIGNALLNEQGFLPPDLHVVGDCAYPLLNALMTPYRETGHLTQMQLNYNYKLSSSRIVIEQAFGKLLGRFRRLKMLDVYDKNLGGIYIMTCCILHNICQRLGDDIDAVEYESDVPHQTVPRSTPSGTHKRDEIAQLLFSD